jgi:HlyD family secretion protein
MQIEADVDENDIGQIKKDQKVRFTVQAYPSLAFERKVRQVRLLPETVQNVVNYTVIIDVSNEKGLLLPGMTATIDFIIIDHENALLVPNSALSFEPPVKEEASKGCGLFSDLLRNRRRQEIPPGPPPGDTEEGMAEVFYLAEDKYPMIAFFTPGESDGVYTEVIGDTDLKEGMKLITGVSDQESKKSNIARDSLLPRPEGPHRGGPF